MVRYLDELECHHQLALDLEHDLDLELARESELDLGQLLVNHHHH